MSISTINYDPGNKFSYTAPGESTAATYNYSMNLAIGRYAMDANGKEIIPQKNASGSASPANTLQVRSYYTVTTDEPAYKNYPLTIEGLTQLISTRRARTVEAEIQPMATTIKQRNDKLEELGTTLGQISAGLAEIEENGGLYTDQNLVNTLAKHFTKAELDEVYWKNDDGVPVHDATWDEAELRKANALVKSRVDKLNNEAQTDMSRMETLVSKRDESFSLATDLTSTISDGRTSIINNMGG